MLFVLFRILVCCCCGIGVGIGVYVGIFFGIVCVYCWGVVLCV